MLYFSKYHAKRHVRAGGGGKTHPQLIQLLSVDVVALAGNRSLDIRLVAGHFTDEHVPTHRDRVSWYRFVLFPII
jgi:hypothetical protein